MLIFTDSISSKNIWIGNHNYLLLSKSICLFSLNFHVCADGRCEWWRKQRHERWPWEDCLAALPPSAPSLDCVLSKAPGGPCASSWWATSPGTPRTPCPLNPLGFDARVLWYFRSQDTVLTQQKTGLRPLGGIYSPWRCWEAVQTGCTCSRGHSVFKGGGMTPCHHTCDRWPSLMPLCRGQAERLCDACTLTGGLCHCTNRQTNNRFYEGQANHVLSHQEDECLALYWGSAELRYCTWDVIHQHCVRRTTSLHCPEDK